MLPGVFGQLCSYPVEGDSGITDVPGQVLFFSLSAVFNLNPTSLSKSPDLFITDR